MEQFNSMARDFKKDLQFAESFQNSPQWTEIYNKAYPDHQSIIIIPGDDKRQYKGVDCIVETEHGSLRNVEEKIDSWPPSNMFIEYLSCAEVNTPGWIEYPAETQDLLYIFVNHGIAYKINFKHLQAVWKIHKNDWIKRYQRGASTKSGYGGYSSLGCAVPVVEVQKAIDEYTRLPKAFMKLIEFNNTSAL